MLKRDMTIANYDPQLWQAITDETRRQEEHIELIASENYTSPRVMEAQGSQLTNKYAEGYPSKRYYGGCEYVDVVETLAIERAKELFGATYANVQPHSGSQANAAVFLAALKPGTRVEFGVADGKRGPQALSIRVLDAPASVTKAARKPAEDMAVILEDLIKLMDSASNQLRRGRYPSDDHCRKLAAVMRAVADDFDV